MIVVTFNWIQASIFLCSLCKQGPWMAPQLKVSWSFLVRNSYPQKCPVFLPAGDDGGGMGWVLSEQEIHPEIVPYSSLDSRSEYRTPAGRVLAWHWAFHIMYENTSHPVVLDKKYELCQMICINQGFLLSKTETRPKNWGNKGRQSIDCKVLLHLRSTEIIAVLQAHDVTGKSWGTIRADIDMDITGRVWKKEMGGGGGGSQAQGTRKVPQDPPRWALSQF